MNPAPADDGRDDARAPVLTWPALYAVVLLALAACIAALAWLTGRWT